MIKTYSDVIEFQTFKERYEYLRIKSDVGVRTFGSDRIYNQLLYKSHTWRKLRNQIIIRDSGFDLAMEGYNIVDGIFIHHINPISLYDIKTNSSIVYDPENLICVSFETHNAIHFGNRLHEIKIINRTRHDTSPWRKRG